MFAIIQSCFVTFASAFECSYYPFDTFQGFKRVFDSMTDITLDVPNAYSYLERFAEMCQKEKVMPDDAYRDVPMRYVSTFRVDELYPLEMYFAAIYFVKIIVKCVQMQDTETIFSIFNAIAMALPER